MTVTADRQKFCEAVDRVSIITSEKSRVIKFRLLHNLINMTASDSENGTATEDIIVQYEGEEIEIGFNSKYILDMLNHLDGEKLILEFCDSTSPLIVKESLNNDLIYVLMPMRV
jgi:DNA polymerase-3 subunit beta